MSSRVIKPADYLSEAEVLAKWPMLTAKELKKARKNKAITFYAFRGGPCYTAEQVQEYIDRTYLQGETCVSQETPGQNPLSRLAQIPPTPTNILSSAASTSTVPIPTVAASCMPAGMTPELAASAAEVLKQRIGKKPKSNSRPSSSRSRPSPGQPPLVLIKS